MGLPFLMALLAAGGVLLIVWALLGARTSDPVQARLTQLGTLEGVTSLEEIELQQPLMDRTLRPLMRRLSGIGTRLTSRERIGRTETKLAEAGYPYGLRTIDFMGLKVVTAIVISGLAFLLFGVAMNNPAATTLIIAGTALLIGFFVPDYWLTTRIKARQKAILLANVSSGYLSFEAFEVSPGDMLMAYQPVRNAMISAVLDMISKQSDRQPGPGKLPSPARPPIPQEK